MSKDDAQDPRLDRSKMELHKRKRSDVVAELGEALKRAVAAKDLEGARKIIFHDLGEPRQGSRWTR